MLYLAIALATFGMLRECDDSYFVLCSKVEEVDCPEIGNIAGPCHFKQCSVPKTGCVAGNIWPGTPFEDQPTLAKIDETRTVPEGEPGHLRVSRLGFTYCYVRYSCDSECKLFQVSYWCQRKPVWEPIHGYRDLTMTVECVGGF